MKNAIQRRKTDAHLATAFDLLDRAIAQLGLGTVADALVTHPATVSRWQKKRTGLSSFMASQIQRILLSKVT